MANKRQLALGVFLTRHGHHPGAWRQPGSAKSGRPDFNYWADLVRTAERGKLDTAFFADFAGQSGDSTKGIERRHAFLDFEPLTLTAALASITSRIGLVATVNTNFEQPYALARRFASIDHISGGRIGWNIVSSLADGAAKSFGLDQPLSHSERYERASEFVDVARALWDSWEDDAFEHADAESGIYLDANDVHPVRHEGKHFRISTVLDTARPIQGHPVFVQAGNSEVGREFAAKYAEMIYAAAQFIEEAQRFYADVKGRMAKHGRDLDTLKVMPGLSFAIGSSLQEAQDKFAALESAVDFSGELNLMGHDVSAYPLDGPLPDLPEPENGKGRWRQLTALARRENLTIRQLFLRFNAVRGHRVAIGTPGDIADQIQDWFERDAADGFNLIPPLLPSSLTEFVDLVVPELQRRGLFRTEYEGTTLRAHLNLPRPQIARSAETPAQRILVPAS
ncbi:LLM class flavin-dependent oxidoreductase [Sphingomonas sp. DG1-23]|uniref:LLM class flavin-dependent oxidoreductase n=1 Tax=Sphingomonas sp. DG1-23 TaxID=3068316 RepID=UPI00274024BE|nr:LLM class flavin-dependent oxidoreductase [Sphingomonas sp. DG1-23]MDP5278265.1 LLM class flavin-dependent oxidoreductase [Sphingomonas sp. DG1-23]